MKRIVIILIGLISVAYGQSSPTSAKTRFVNGLYVGTKLDSYFAAADSNAIYWRADSALMAKYKGAARRVVFSGELSSYIPYSDTTSLLSQVVRTFGTQTVGGNKTITNDLLVNSLRVGRGGSSVGSNVAYGVNALAANTTGSNNTAIGTQSLITNTDASNNTAVGNGALNQNNGANNTAVGVSALLSNTSGTSNTSVGRSSMSSNTTGFSNASLGEQSLTANTTGYGNAVLGQGAMQGNTTGFYSIGIGQNALLNHTTGNRNIGIGLSSGGAISTGTNSIYIGSGTVASSGSVANEIAIGTSVTGNGSNTVTIGNSSVTDNYFSGNIRSSNGTAFLKNIAVGSSSDSVLVTNNGEVRRVLQSSIGSGSYLPIGNVSGTTNYIPKFTSSSAIGNSTLFDNGSEVGVGTATPTSGYRLNVSGLQRNFGANNALNFGELDANSIYFQALDNGFTTSKNILFLGTAEYGRFASDGTFIVPGVYSATVGGTNRDVFVDNTGLIGYVSSFRASKKNIKPIYATDWIHKLNPVTFNYRVKDSLGNYTDSAYKELEYGLVAEEVENVNKEMVFYDVDTTGKQKLRGVHYSKLIIPLLAEVQEHKKRIDAQDKVIEALLTRIKALEAKLN